MHVVSVPSLSSTVSCMLSTQGIVYVWLEKVLICTGYGTEYGTDLVAWDQDLRTTSATGGSRDNPPVYQAMFDGNHNPLDGRAIAQAKLISESSV